MNAIDIGRRLRRQREALGLKQDEVAKRAGKGREWLGRLENGKSGTKLEDLLLVVEALGVRLIDIASETDDPSLAEVRRTLPDGTVVAVSYDRPRRRTEAQARNEQEILAQVLRDLTEQLILESETDPPA